MKWLPPLRPGVQRTRPSGVAFFRPFSNNRYFFPWQVFQVARLGIRRFFSERGTMVLKSELAWIWLPCAAFALVGAVARRGPGLPEKRMQRTGSSPSACRSRWILRPDRQVGAHTWLGVALVCMAVTTACASSHRFQNLVVWNQADQPERVAITVDGLDVYTGILGTVDSFPKIVRTQSLAFPLGEHVLSVVVPGRGFKKQVTFVVGEQPVNLHVMINRDEIQVGVTYGPEAYL